jgi:hypothetical protein
MQLLEAGLGLRSAIIELRRKDGPLRFVLFPMVHIAEPTFYTAVMERLRECDIVVCEGIHGKSRTVSALTSSYRLVKGGRFGLVRQHLDIASLGVPIVRPDISGDAFDHSWRDVPLTQRLLLWSLLPVYIPLTFLLGSRERLAKHLALEDEHGIGGRIEGTEEIDKVILDDRDRLLVDALSTIHDTRGDEPLKVGVVYGAQHMIAVVHGLSARYGYRPRSAGWLTVFDF